MVDLQLVDRLTSWSEGLQAVCTSIPNTRVQQHNIDKRDVHSVQVVLREELLSPATAILFSLSQSLCSR